MGVMSCNRKGCKSTMCDTYIDDVGYICHKCQEEFKKILMDNTDNNPEFTEKEFIEELKPFMNYDVNEFSDEGYVDFNTVFDKFKINR